ncbi:peptide permease [Megasphaera cerevisiae DSM 20462]|uniref:Peptide permease n=1 Tax=Megasphaera cerevisiae DSM 20462 TaxID=1122219 RepID=A0A0J6ZNU2_9FIRM|nr:ABC transporter permease [Megasphaera cerevisiae]KMO86541.1 peptide permease [Megasphaera cerevisiae DSM 20462]OKY53770.1 peptide permease [Megasphaera cerevisiae]SJZ89812.1 peptide/nickel transport system permease protein [Megasphaera cerevisiae DSM 20462]
MGTYILKRLAISIPVLFFISVGAFVLVHLTPGDPADMYITPDMTQAQIELTRASLGLDRPLFIQYFDWISNFLTGNLGFSFGNRQPVLDIIGQRLSPTLLLMSLSLLVAYLTAIPLGIIAALRKDTLTDRFIIGWTFLNVSFPPFFLGLALIYIFAVKLDILPTGGMSVLGAENGAEDLIMHLILPVIVMASQFSANMIRYVRASVIDVMHQNYIRTALAKGLNRRQILWHHVLRNSLIPIVTVIGTDLPKIIGGAVITEQIFQWPGIGSLTVAAINSRDYPILMAIVILSAVAVLIANFVIDILYALIDPRIKYGK